MNCIWMSPVEWDWSKSKSNWTNSMDGAREIPARISADSHWLRSAPSPSCLGPNSSFAGKHLCPEWLAAVHLHRRTTQRVRKFINLFTLEMDFQSLFHSPHSDWSPVNMEMVADSAPSGVLCYRHRGNVCPHRCRPLPLWCPRKTHRRCRAVVCVTPDRSPRHRPRQVRAQDFAFLDWRKATDLRRLCSRCSFDPLLLFAANVTIKHLIELEHMRAYLRQCLDAVAWASMGSELISADRFHVGSCDDTVVRAHRCRRSCDCGVYSFHEILYADVRRSYLLNAIHWLTR